MILGSANLGSLLDCKKLCGGDLEGGIYHRLALPIFASE